MAWECPVCMTDGLGRIRVLKCGHLFHSVCLRASMNAPGRGRNRCPMCRSYIRGHITVRTMGEIITCIACRGNMSEAEHMSIVLDCGHPYHHHCLHTLVHNGPWYQRYTLLTCPECHLHSPKETTIYL